MLSGANKNQNTKVLNSLISDLKRPLILIARQAELGQAREGKLDLQSIRQTAENSLRLIDSYLLAAQSEYGQQLLPIETFSVGSIIYEVAKEIQPITRKSDVRLILEVSDGLVTTNRKSLEAVIWCLSEMALSKAMAGQSGGMMEINTKKSADSLKISVLSDSIQIKNSQLDKAQNSLGKSHMALNSASSDSGIRLAIASLLAESLGTKLRAVKSNKTQGVGFSLNLSQQLQLI